MTERIIPSWPAHHSSERARWCIAYLNEHRFITSSESRKLTLRLLKTLIKVAKFEQKTAVKNAEREKVRKKQAAAEAEESGAG